MIVKNEEADKPLRNFERWSAGMFKVITLSIHGNEGERAYAAKMLGIFRPYKRATHLPSDSDHKCSHTA